METSETTDSFNQRLIGRDTLRLLLRFVAIIVIAPLIGWMMARAWVPGHQIYDLVANSLNELMGVPPAKALQLVGMGALGLYFGFLTIFLLDVKKRVQGALLLIGTIMGLGVLAYQGVLFPNVDLGYRPNIAAFVILYLSALVLDIDKLFSISLSESSLTDFRTANDDIPEFRNAARGLFTVLLVGILLTLAQVWLADTFRAFDPIVSLAGIYLLYSFIQYEVKSDYMLLGPGKSGKSMAMLGMALVLYDFDDVQPDPNPYLQRAIERSGDPQNEDEWPFEQTEGLQETSFQMLVGNVFPKRMRLIAYDYPGQLLPTISRRVEEMSSGSIARYVPFLEGSSSSSPRVNTDGGTAPEAMRAEIIAQNVIDSDILMVVIDCERLVHPEEFGNESGAASPDGGDRPLGIEYYKPILNSIDPDRVILAATKADVLIHDQSLPVETPEQAGGYDQFKQQVEGLLDQRYDIQELKQQLEQPNIHPVFYKTRRVNGEYVPIRDQSNNLIPVGYRELIDVIRRAQ
ncbi:MAG: hypothetical protein ABEI52_03780 [Halobacteriaceae archaeon]